MTSRDLGHTFPGVLGSHFTIVGRLVDRVHRVSLDRSGQAVFWERDVAQLIDDDAIQSRELPDDLPCVTLGLFPDPGIDQVDGIEEAGLLAVVDQRGSERDGDLGFAPADTNLPPFHTATRGLIRSHSGTSKPQK